jgi:hypothetical protein
MCTQVQVSRRDVAPVEHRTRTRISAIRTSSNSIPRTQKAPILRESWAYHDGIGIDFFLAGCQERITPDDRDCSSSTHLIGGSAG